MHPLRARSIANQAHRYWMCRLQNQAVHLEMGILAAALTKMRRKRKKTKRNFRKQKFRQSNNIYKQMMRQSILMKFEFNWNDRNSFQVFSHCDDVHMQFIQTYRTGVKFW